MNPPDDDAGIHAQARLAELEAQIALLRSELADLSAATLPLAGEGAAESAATAPEPVYPDVDSWVEDYFTVVFARPIGGEIRWCPKWRDHPEAVTRLEALWRSWEALRLDPNLGMITWLTHYLDPQVGSLGSRVGTFAGCSANRHSLPSAQPSDC